MSLKSDLLRAKTEEDVKDAYIKAIGLKAYSKTLVDIRTKEIWFEAKGVPTPPVVMFTQLLFYVRSARKLGEQIPPFLCVIDTEKAAIMETANALPILNEKTIKWPKSGSKVDKSLAVLLAPLIETHIVVYQIDTYERDFIATIRSAISAGKIIRTSITPDNLRQVFDKWVVMIGRELTGVSLSDYALLFFADIMHDGKKAAVKDLPAKLLHDDDKPVFFLNGVMYELNSLHGYRNFWAIYHRPPEEEYRRYLLERRDTLLPLDEREFKGAYYTPLAVVDKAYDELAAVLGKNWQQRYIVWDMCCGVGNLEVKHSNYRNVFMSTIDQADIDVMRASHTCVGATIFQYDYLNDDINELGLIDYSLSNKMPLTLQNAIADAMAKKKGAKKLLVLINPPYAEATSSDNAANKGADRSKTGVARSKFASASMAGYGKASNELFTQFLARIHKEVPTAIVASFGKLKYVNSQAFEEFRKVWQAKYLGGFVVHSKAFDDLKGEFPIGFLIWDTSKPEPITEIVTDVLDRNAAYIGDKTYTNVENDLLLSTWPVRPKTNSVPALPLKGAVEPATTTADLRGTKWSNGAIGWFNCAGNDLQQANRLTMLLSSGFASGRGFFINKDNLWQVAVMFTVRRIIKPTWLNDRDQFLQPNKALSDEFKSDCLVWTLFNSANYSASVEKIRWNGADWPLINHFLPFKEAEIGAKTAFASSFMATYMSKLTLSAEAKAVMKEGRRLFQHFHQQKFGRTIVDDFKLGRPDVGWWQVRRALKANLVNEQTNFQSFDVAYEKLSEKLIPQVFELGFLPA
ncbi:hypothetical protein K1X45_10965 [Pseudochrobactrum sp. Wa41.01b-1]|uniref:hypothetical protein n=1 Tax=Pseudochrobactrum sp. Wa41.01b-1 TaxID=2864102 RepID=UPI001C692401|nr:hypothetical protein [Pseudochrobactrum sp. Wa41.01b-1]QYM72026.1 hypothetical protein K1X45_10965 [Pseudochrobactrum sp. Wa41.01b-1]